MVFLIGFGTLEGQTLKKNTTSQYGKYTWYQYPGDTVAAQIMHVINTYLAVSQYGAWTVTIDQTTDGTTNKVQARNATHGDFQVNANLQVGNADVDATNPVISKPYLPYVRSVDTWGASADTSEYDFGNNYLKGYVTVYDSSATADTLVFEVYSHAKSQWTTQMIGFRDVVTDYLEIDNTTVIIAGTIAKKFEINKLRPGKIRVRPKTPGAVWRTKRVVFEGVN